MKKSRGLFPSPGSGLLRKSWPGEEVAANQTLGQRQQIEGEVSRVDTVTCCQVAKRQCPTASPYTLGGKRRKEFPDCRHSKVTASRSYTPPSGGGAARARRARLGVGRQPQATHRQAGRHAHTHTHITQPNKMLKQKIWAKKV